jgi:hypothetical protein
MLLDDLSILVLLPSAISQTHFYKDTILSCQKEKRIRQQSRMNADQEMFLEDEVEEVVRFAKVKVRLINPLLLTRDYSFTKLC